MGKTNSVDWPQGIAQQVRDGQYGFSKELGRFCGVEFPSIIYSSDRYLWLHFHSDENIEYEGFQAVYKYMPRPTSCNHPPAN